MAKMFGRKNKEPIPEGIVTSEDVAKEAKEERQPAPEQPNENPVAEPAQEESKPAAVAHDEPKPETTAEPKAPAAAKSGPNHMRRLFVLGLVAAVLIAGGYFGLRYYQEKNKPVVNDQAAGISSEIPQSVAAKITAEQKKALAEAKTAQQKSNALCELAGTYMATNPKLALDYAKQAVAAKETIRADVTLAQAEVANGDKAAAADAYQKAADLAKASSNPEDKSAAAYFQKQAKDLRS